MPIRRTLLVRAPLLSRSGYGEQSRFALRALRSRPELFDLHILNLNWGSTGQITKDPGEASDSFHNEEIDFIHQCIIKAAQHTQQGGQFDLSLQITVPNEFEKIAPVNIGYTAGIETTKVASVWIEKTNAVIDKLIVVSNHSKKVFNQTKYDAQDQHGNTIKDWGLTTPVEVVNYPSRVATPQELDIDLTTENNFLVVSQWGPRKNVNDTIKWFVEEFREDKSAGLILKTNMAADSTLDREYTTVHLQALLNSLGEYKCKIYLLHGDIPEGGLSWLYRHPTMKALINISHGEGYGLPLFEAACAGLPLVTVTWSGQMDFICKPNKKGKMVPRVVAVDYDIQNVQTPAVWPGVIEADSKWAFARQASFKRALRTCIEKEGHCRQEAATLQKYILKKFTEKELYAEFVGHIADFCSAQEEQEEWSESLGSIELS